MWWKPFGPHEEGFFLPGCRDAGWAGGVARQSHSREVPDDAGAEFVPAEGPHSIWHHLHLL